MPAIETLNLCKNFGDHQAVNDLSLQVDEGEIYGFLGPNGAGKTTTVRILATLLNPSSGKVTIAGHDVVTQKRAVKLKIGLALQEIALDEQQTGRELLTLQARLYGLTKQQVKERTEAMVELVNIGSAVDSLISTYSGGMKRRLDLAAALIHNPEVLFLDEPTTGLDPISRTSVWDEITRVNRELGTTILLTTQYLEEADILADRVGIINRGRLVANGTPSDLKRSVGDDVIEVSVENRVDDACNSLRDLDVAQSVSAEGNSITVKVSDGAAAATPVAVALNSLGIRVTQLTLRSPTLDDVFMAHTGARMDSEETQSNEQ